MTAISKMVLSEGKQQQPPSRMQARRLAEFYEGKNILITGATGFIGKVCLLKLMSSLGNCGTVYIILRGKKGLTPQQRFNKMIQELPFNRDLMNFDHFPNPDEMQKKFGKISTRVNPIDWSKVVPIEGDMRSDNLGLSGVMLDRVSSSVHIIINNAASVKFDATLKNSLSDNYLGTRTLLNMATKFKQLISFVHISTFYSNSHLRHIEEKVYPMKSDCEKMAELISWVPEPVLETLGPQLMENRLNTYIFTKAMTEDLLQRYQGQLPLAILRPSIVVPALKEPEPGWVDSVNGPMGLGVLGALGIARNDDWNIDGLSDLVPVDTVVNSILAVAERTSRLNPKEIKVYNCSSSSLCPIDWTRALLKMQDVSLSAPPYKMLRIPVRVPKTRVPSSKIRLAFTKLSEILFAYFVDLILFICGQKPILRKITAKLHNGYNVLSPFNTVALTCTNDNLLAALDELHDEDKVEFDFNFKAIDWDEYLKFTWFGVRKRLIREDLSNVQAALIKMRILATIEFLIKTAFYCYIGWRCYSFYISWFNPDEYSQHYHETPTIAGPSSPIAQNV